MSLEALVVGINIYKYSRLPNLYLPSEDAEVIAKRLKNDGGFRVTRLPEMIEDDDSVRVDPDDTVTVKQLKKAIEQLFLPQGEHPPDTALLYFSGHGLRDDSQIKQGYLATSDVNSDDEKWGLSLKWLRQVLEASPIKRQIIWLDCCYSGELLNFKENLEKETDPGNQEGYNRCFITASRAFEVAFEETSGNHGVLTGALLRGLDPTQQPDGWVTNYSLADFINRELQTETQRPLCHNSGKAIVLTNNQPKKQLGECPYKGLESFNLKDAHFFYGRTGLTDELIKRVEKSNFVAVLGASGSGKSSVLSAGLLYKLKRGEDLLGSDRWQFYPPFNPGEHPLQNLKAAIGKEPNELDQLIVTAEAERVVLIVDQFEECFTLCKDEECQKFLDCLLGAVERTGNKFCLVLGMRADFLDKCTQYPKLADKIESENLAIVKPLDREELEEAIMEPAKKVGLQVEPRLVERMIKDVVSSPGRLPLLQDALRELWNEAQKAPDKHLLTLDSYEALGGIEQILERRANKTYDEELKTDAERLVAKRVFLELTNVGEETEVKVTLKPVHKERLVENVSFGESKEVVNRAIAVLEKARLIVTSDAGVVSIAHQALIDNWKKLRQWVEENPEARRKKQKIEAAAEEWQDKGKSKGYLSQGERLVEAEGFVQKYAETVPLSSLAQEFVQKSIKRRRNRRLILSSSVATFILGLGTAAIVANSQRIEADRQRVNQQLNALTASSEALFVSKNWLEALVEAIKAGKQLQTGVGIEADTRMQVITTLLQESFNNPELNRLEGHSGAVNSVSFSPDGQTIATASADKTVKLWSRDGKLLKTLEGHKYPVSSLTFSPDNQIIVSAGFNITNQMDGELKLWNRNGKAFKTLVFPRFYFINKVQFSPDGQVIAVAHGNGVLLLSRDGRLLNTFIKPNKPDSSGQGFLSVSFSPDSRIIATNGAKDTVKLLSRNGQLLKTLEGQGSFVRDVSFSPNGEIIATAGNDQTVKLYSIEGKLLKTLKGHNDFVRSVSFSPNSQIIATASEDKTVKLWNRDGKLLKTLEGHRRGVGSVSFSPDGETIASASDDQTVKLWKSAELELWAVQSNNGGWKVSTSLSFSPDGEIIAFAGGSNVVALYKSDGTQLKKLLEHGTNKPSMVGSMDLISPRMVERLSFEVKDGVRSVSFSPNSQFIATAAGDNTVKLWSRDGRELRILKGHKDGVNSVSFSPNGQLIVSASDDKTARLWNLDGKQIGKPLEYDGGVKSATFSPDGELIVTASDDATIKLWKSDGILLKTLRGHKDGVNWVSFSPDGQTIASASGDYTVKLWRRDGTFLRTLKGHNDNVNSVSFSPDGQIIVSASSDKTVRFWNRNGREIKALNANLDSIYSLSFSPDGKRLFIASGDGIVATLGFSLDLNGLLKTSCNWVENYLKNNNNVRQEDRSVCADIKTYR